MTERNPTQAGKRVQGKLRVYDQDELKRALIDAARQNNILKDQLDQANKERDQALYRVERVNKKNRELLKELARWKGRARDNSDAIAMLEMWQQMF